jgi:predicted patatin/cPLA2 family phospholipase
MSHELLAPQHIGVSGEIAQHPVIRLMVDRLYAGSKRGSRSDGHNIALANEGGGTAGVVSAGMNVALEGAGLIETVDRIYGTSSGALNGAFTAAGQADLGATNYEGVIDPRFANIRHLLRGKPVINFDFLFNEVMGSKEPLDFEALQKGPDFRATSVNLDTSELTVLKDFKDTDDVMAALRVSCAMPVLSGLRPPMYHGVSMTDGALLASVPFRAAIEDGSTHVLALRSRGENYRKSPYSAKELWITRTVGGKALAKLVAARPALYNADAQALQSGESTTAFQLTPEGVDSPVDQIEKSLQKVREGFKLGVAAVGKTFGMPELDVIWNQRPEIVIK